MTVAEMIVAEFDIQQVGSVFNSSIPAAVRRAGGRMVPGEKADHVLKATIPESPEVLTNILNEIEAARIRINTATKEINIKPPLVKYLWLSPSRPEPDAIDAQAKGQQLRITLQRCECGAGQ